MKKTLTISRKTFKTVTEEGGLFIKKVTVSEKKMTNVHLWTYMFYYSMLNLNTIYIQ